MGGMDWRTLWTLLLMSNTHIYIRGTADGGTSLELLFPSCFIHLLPGPVRGRFYVLPFFTLKSIRINLEFNQLYK